MVREREREGRERLLWPAALDDGCTEMEGDDESKEAGSYVPPLQSDRGSTSRAAGDLAVLGAMGGGGDDVRTLHFGVRPDPSVPKHKRPNFGFCDNSIRTTRYTVFSFLPLSFFAQFRR